MDIQFPLIGKSIYLIFVDDRSDSRQIDLEDFHNFVDGAVWLGHGEGMEWIN